MGEKIKKQHYVPRCYLKAWEIDGKHQIYVYDKDKQESRINNIEDVASGRYFYDLSLRDLIRQSEIEEKIDNMGDIDIDAKIQSIEKALSIGIEGPYAEFLTKILGNARKASSWYLKNCFFLHPESKEEFAGLLAIQYVRTAHVRNMIRDISDEISQFVEKMGASPEVQEKYKTLTKNEAKSIHLNMLMEEEHLSEIAFCFNRLKWGLGINRTGINLYTSDNPICVVPHCNNGPMPMTGLTSKGVEVFITLSPDCVLIMRDGDYHKGFAQRDMKYTEIEDKEIIYAYNAFISMFAERNIFSKDGEFSQLEQLKTEDFKLTQFPQTTLTYRNSTIKSRVRR